MFAFKPISFSLVLALAGLAGCASVEVGTGFDEVSGLVTERGSATFGNSENPATHAGVDVQTFSNLNGSISIDRALHIALTNSPNLQAQYARLAISRADVLQAGVVRNPTVDATVGVGITGDPTRFALGALFPILDLVYRKSRTKAARADFRAIQIEVAESVIGHANEVAGAYLELAQSTARLKARQDIVDVVQSQLQAIERLVASGTIDGSEFAELQVMSSLAEIEHNAERGERNAARTKLAGLIGTPLENELNTNLELESISNDDIGVEALSEQAHRQRLDLIRAEQEVNVRKLALERADRRFNEDSNELGLELEDEEDERFLGPSVSVEVPIFDRGEIRRMKAEAELIEAERRLKALRYSIDTDVQVAYQRVLTRSATALAYQNTLVPSVLTRGTLTLERFNAGAIDVADFLESQRAISNAKLEAIDAAAAYWKARVELAQAIGGWPSGLKPEDTRLQ